MSMVGHPPAFHYDLPADPNAGAQPAAARPSFDLRLHALITLVAAAIAVAYCGFRVLDLGIATPSGGAAGAAPPQDIYSFGACAIFIAAATLGLVEAFRSLRDAAIVGSRNGPDTIAGAAKAILFSRSRRDVVSGELR